MRNIEASLICRLIKGNVADIQKFNSYRLTADNFHTYTEQFQFIHTFKEKYGKMPGQDALKREFPDFELYKTKESVEYYCDKLVQRETGMRLKDVSRKLSPFLQSGKFVEASNLLRAELERIDFTSTAKSMDWKNTSRFKTAVLNRALELKSGTTYLTPYQKLNKAIICLRPQNLVTISGRLGFGKTWMLLLFALHMLRTSKARVLIISNEMSAEEFADRLDAIDARISWINFMSGTLTPKHRLRYKKMLRRRKTYPGRLHIVDDTTIERKDISSLVSEIDKFRPDVVFVDGIAQYDCVGSKDEVQKIMNISRRMKRIAKARKILLFQTAQQNRTAEGKKKGGGVGGISWGDALAQDSDLVFEIIAPEGRESSIRILSIIKGRNVGYTEVAFNLKMEPYVDLNEMGKITGQTLDDYFATVKKVPK